MNCLNDETIQFGFWKIDYGGDQTIHFEFWKIDYGGDETIQFEFWKMVVFRDGNYMQNHICNHFTCLFM